MKNIIDNALEYIEEVFKTDYSGHDYFHTLRVYKTSPWVKMLMVVDPYLD